MTDDEHEDHVGAVAAEPVPAAEEPSILDTIIERIEKWFAIEFPGTIFADTPEKHNDLRKKIDNLIQHLKIKE